MSSAATVVREFETLANSPAMTMAVTAWRDLLIANHMDSDQFPVGWDHRALIAFREEKAIGFLTWSDLAWSNTLHVVLAYVVPACRRQHVHTLMFGELVRRAQELQRPVITGGTSIYNKAMRATFAAQGRQETAVMTRFVVPKPGARP
jgi:hypothetical protein